MPAALPAVTLPCARNGVFSVASVSRVVPGRIGSSVDASPQPSSEERVADRYQVGLDLAGVVRRRRLGLRADGVGVDALAG